MIIKIEIETIAHNTKVKSKIDEMGIKWANKSNKDKCFEFMYIDTKKKICDGVKSRTIFNNIACEKIDIDKFLILSKQA